MKFNLIYNYPWWYILLCVMAGVAVAMILYYRNRSEDFTSWKLWLLSVFRFSVVTGLCFLLLAPLLKMQVVNTQEPVILLFHDNSQSLVTAGDNPTVSEEYLEELAKLKNDLSSSYNVISHTFGEQVTESDTFTFTERITDMSEVFNSLEVLYSNRNVGAVIIASDGIYNRGSNPYFPASEMLSPVYSIALGDTIPKKDLIINHIRHNRITYLNNIFPLEVTVEARQATGMNSNLRILHQGNEVARQVVSFDSDNHFQTFTFELPAKETGIKRYRIELDAIEGEVTTENNVREFFIEVIDSRQKILLLAASPHPDVGALKQALDDNENYETTVALISDFRQNIRDYDIIIWHQLPSVGQNASPLINASAQANIPQLFIIGALTNIPAFNRLETGVQLSVRSAGFNDSRAAYNQSFTLFQPTPEALELIPLFPPLQTHFASFSLAPATQVLFYQKIGNVETDYPLMAFSQTTETKTGVITGEGIWRWRLNNFARNNNHDAFNELITRAVQFLAVVEDKSFFRVNVENFILENEPAIFEAELYNPSYELVNTPDVILSITNEEGAVFEYTFARTANTYRINAGLFPVGEYRWSARTTLGNEEYTADGIFTVSPLNIEGINTVANHQLMYQVASATGGSMFYPDQLNELTSELLQREDIKPVLYSQYQYEDLISLKWIFFLLLILLSVEWFTRKYSGSY